MIRTATNRQLGGVKVREPRRFGDHQIVTGEPVGTAQLMAFMVSSTVSGTLQPELSVPAPIRRSPLNTGCPTSDREDREAKSAATQGRPTDVAADDLQADRLRGCIPVWSLSHRLRRA